MIDALSVHLSQARSITSFHDRHAVAKFSKPGVYDKVPEGSDLIFGDNRISFNTVYDGWMEAHMLKTSSIRSAILVELRLVTDRHRPMASTTDA